MHRARHHCTGPVESLRGVRPASATCHNTKTPQPAKTATHKSAGLTGGARAQIMGPTTVQGCHQTNASTTSPQRATHLRQQPPRQHQHRHLPQTPPTAHIESLFIPKQRRTGNVTTQADYNPPPPLQPENGATVACRGQACSEGRYVGGGAQESSRGPNKPATKHPYRWEALNNKM